MRDLIRRLFRRPKPRDYTMCIWECSVCLADRERKRNARV